MFKYLLSNVYELVSRATLLALSIFPMAGTYNGLLEFAGDWSDWVVRGLLIIAGFLTAKPLAKFAAVASVAGFSYLYTEQATELFNKVVALF